MAEGWVPVTKCAAPIKNDRNRATRQGPASDAIMASDHRQQPLA